jgi:hypothetical protein
LIAIFCPFLATAQQPPNAGNDRGGRGFAWAPAAAQSAFFLGVEHGFRLMQSGTRAELRGRFFPDYIDSLRGINGWEDADTVFTNYVGHPMQGAVAGYIQIHNDPVGKYLRIGSTADYWKSRLKATAWSAAYSTQFEIGAVSEATLGNVGKKPGTGGYVDFVMTPAGGLGWILAEDALDHYLIRPREENTPSIAWRRFYRMALNPTRTFANLLRLKKPWHRDDRPISGLPRVGLSNP